MKTSSLNIFRVAILSLLWLTASTSLALAQSQTTGAVSGFVLDINDQTKGIGEAVVTVENVNTGFKLTVKTRANGEYSFDFLNAGIYRISTTCDGYDVIDESKIPKFDVNFSTVTRPQPPPLSLRKTGATALPSAPVAPPLTSIKQLVNLEDATRRASFNAATITALPLAGMRTFDQLAFLAPGVAPPPQAIGNIVGPGIGAGVGTSGQFAVNGLRSRANNFTVDGSDNNDEDIGVRRQGFTALIPQPIESIQEFQIKTLLPRSQYGRNLGAQADAVSLDGGLALHGTAYGFLTNQRLNARNAFDLTDPRSNILRRANNGQPIQILAVAGTPISADARCSGALAGQLCLPDQVVGESPLTRGQYGLTLGGPVTPKTFFFGSLERRNILKVTGGLA